MDMIATAKLTAAAAILAATSSPALARGERSADSLPSFKASSQISAFRTAPRSTFSNQFSTSSSLSSRSFGQASSSFAARPATDAAVGFAASPSAAASAFGGSGLGDLLSRFLPPRIVERLRNIATRPGPGGELICSIFGFAGCDNPDSPG